MRPYHLQDFRPHFTRYLCTLFFQCRQHSMTSAFSHAHLLQFLYAKHFTIHINLNTATTCEHSPSFSATSSPSAEHIHKYNLTYQFQSPFVRKCMFAIVLITPIPLLRPPNRAALPERAGQLTQAKRCVRIYSILRVYAFNLILFAVCSFHTWCTCFVCECLCVCV